MELETALRSSRAWLRFGSPDLSRSQYPLVALMVAYTMLSLWILAQPIVESSG